MIDTQDSALVERGRRGDRTALAGLIDRYQKPVFNAALRIPIRLEISVLEASDRDLLMTQTEDVSATGMLVHCRRTYPLGSRARFEMRLPNETEPVRGEAEVARLTERDIDRIQGMGMRFLSFDNGGEARFLQRLEGAVTS